MELASIASGSSGNSIYVGNKKTNFLVDTGVSRKRIVDGLTGFMVDPAKLDGIFITHEHIDHIGGLGVFLRKYPTPVFATGKTIDAIKKTSSLGKVDYSLFESITPDQPIRINNVTVKASHIYHDAADPVCYTFYDEDSKVGIATDLGTYDDYLTEQLTGCESLLVEANHDLNMLMAGPYSYPLKRRIMGNKGHLSNERAGQFLSKIAGRELKHILLGHLSKENNYGELAYETVRVELMIHNIDLDKEGITMQVADRETPTCCI